MPVFKLITQVPFADDVEVIRWNMEESVDQITWARLMEQAQQLVHQPSCDLRLRWFGKFIGSVIAQIEAGIFLSVILALEWN